jgi:hypothetical protein
VSVFLRRKNDAKMRGVKLDSEQDFGEKCLGFSKGSRLQRCTSHMFGQAYGGR